eukprot:scaffold31084_cov37-Cyclotella_meneghiniana.AAC.4
MRTTATAVSRKPALVKNLPSDLKPKVATKLKAKDKEIHGKNSQGAQPGSTKSNKSTKQAINHSSKKPQGRNRDPRAKSQCCHQRQSCRIIASWSKHIDRDAARKERELQEKAKGFQSLLEAQLTKVYGFPANLSLSPTQDTIHVISKTNSRAYFDRPMNIAFHDLTPDKSMPPATLEVLGLNLKFIKTPQCTTDGQTIYNAFERFDHRDVLLKTFFAGQPDDLILAPTIQRCMSMSSQFGRHRCSISHPLLRNNGKPNLHRNQSRLLARIRRMTNILLVIQISYELKCMLVTPSPCTPTLQPTWLSDNSETIGLLSPTVLARYGK